VLAHNVHPDDAELDLLAQTGTLLDERGIVVK
jgi:cytosine/adenosine deaminase-related metal-dependent hydrolase